MHRINTGEYRYTFKQVPFTWEVDVTLVAYWQDRTIAINVAENVGIDVGIRLQTYDQPEVWQVHSGCFFSAFVSCL